MEKKEKNKENTQKKTGKPRKTFFFQINEKLGKTKGEEKNYKESCGNFCMWNRRT